MRVHFIGNICNNHYVIAKYLRRIGVDAHLFFYKNASMQEQPGSEDPELLGNPPKWCHAYTDADTGSYPWEGVTPGFLETLSKCDLIHAHDYGLIWAAQTNRPYVWHPYGHDLYSWLSFKYCNKDFYPAARWLAVPTLMREAASRASAIIIEWWYDCWAPGLRIIKSLDVWDRLVHLPLVVMNTDRFLPDSSVSADKLIRQYTKKGEVEGLVLFHPSRQLISDENPEYFGNDILYRALGEFRKQGGRFTLVVIRKGNPDEELAERIIREVGIEDRVYWIDKMPRSELIKWYQAADITVAELSGGSMGGVGNEAMSCGCPVMTHFLTESEKDTFWPPRSLPPVINTSSDGEVAKFLTYYSEHPSELKELGMKSREWIEYNVSGEVAAEEFLQLYERVLSHGTCLKAPVVRSTAELRALLSERLDSEQHAYAPDSEVARYLLELSRRLAEELEETREQSDPLSTHEPGVKAAVRQVGRSLMARLRQR